jgi:hypothetical protein
MTIHCQCIKGDCENGYGKYIWDSGASFEGEWKNGEIFKGLYIWEDGTKYEGELKNGQRNGYGINNTNEYTYEGNWKDNMFHGYGKYITKSGYFYEGYFYENKYNGKGKEVFSDSSVIYIGDFVMDYKNGKGKWIQQGKFVYEGDFVNDKFEGKGIMTYNDGHKYIGYWKNDKKNGKGKIVYPSGAITEGTWKDNFLITGVIQSKNDNVINFDSTNIIVMEKSKGGIYNIPVLINGKLQLEFIMDTGAADMSITPDVFMTLIRTKTINEDDALEDRAYIDANGDINLNARFTIRSLKIGSKTIYNISCSISNSMTAPILLGQSALQKLGKFMIDYDNNTFIIMD